jgi:voltage-gated potassium channel
VAAPRARPVGALLLRSLDPSQAGGTVRVMPRADRQRKIRQPDRYGALLGLILLDCIVIFTSEHRGPSRWLPAVLIGLTVLVGLDTSQMRGWWVLPTRIAAVAVAAASIVDGINGNDTSLGIIAVLQGTILAILVVAIISRFLGHERVTEQTVLAVICVYVLFGLIFAMFTFGLNSATGRQFFVQNPTPAFSDFVYFSFVVLTTLGFGDLTPATEGGMAIVAFEALLGQLFLVTVVARLVSLYSGTKRSIRAAEQQPPPSTE